MAVKLFIIFCFFKLCLGDDSDKNLFPSLPVAPIKSTSELCRADSVLFVESLNNLTLWAYKMWDATAKSTTGSLQGNQYQLGDFDECRKAKAPFRTQFCLAQVKVNVSWLEPHKDPYALERDPLGSVLRRLLYTSDTSQIAKDVVNIGWCVPASCTLDDLQIALDDHLNHVHTYLIKHNVTYYGKIQEGMCQREGEEKIFDMLDGIFCVILGVIVFIVLIATAYEFKLENELTEKEKHNIQKHMGRRILIYFSARKNFLDLAKTEESNSALAPLYGLRTFSIFAIIAGHRFGTFTSGPVLNFDDIEQSYRLIQWAVIFHGDLFVDTFFILSGLLVTYGLMVQYTKKYVNPGFIIFWRYMRLTPLYAFVIFYYVTLFNYIGSGPLWKLVVYQESKDCKDNWWTNLLYINNYVNNDHMCMTQTWYLACDFHYFIIALLLVIILLKNKKLGFALFILSCILSIVVPFTINLVYERPGMVHFYPEVLRKPKSDTDFMLTYEKSHTRATSYCIGMIAGYIYYKMKDSEKRLSKLKSHSITFVSILLLLVSLLTGAITYNPYREYSRLENAIFAGLHRLPWCLGTIGFILTSSYGHTTVMHTLFSWSPFIPLSRLVYGAYLVHLSLQFRALGITSSSEVFDIFNLFSWTLGDIFLSFMLALVLYLIIETPMRKLFKELFMKPRRPAPVSEPTSTQDHGINSISRRENDSRL